MRKKIISIIFAVIIIFTINNYSNAATASIQCNSTAKVNEPITISVTGSAVQWNLSLKVNGQVIASGSELDNVEGNKTISFSGKYTPTAEGNLTVSLEGSVTEANDGSTVKSFGTKTIKVTKQETSTNNNSNTGNTGTSTTDKETKPTTSEKSSVATLANLGITPNDFSGFKASTYTYDVEVPSDLEKIEIYAKKGQSGQTISGTGVKTLKDGTNKFEIAVTAEDGKTKKTYTINITKKVKEENPEETSEETPDIEKENEEIFGLSELKIEGLDLKPEFKTDVYEYEIKLEEDLENLKIDAIATETNSTVEITGNENLQNGENVITILVQDESGEKTTTYQIVVTKSVTVVEDTVDLETDHSKMINDVIIKMSVAAICVILIIVMIIIYNVQKNKDFDDGYIPYTNLLDEHNDKDLDLNQNDNVVLEETKRKKRSKGKRFK